MIHIISDTHFNHDSMKVWCQRPDNFQDLIKSSLSLIPKDNVLIHLGDICMGSDYQAHEEYIKVLRCKKILILGNHDHKSISWYLSNGWDFVCHSFTMTYYGKKLIFSHVPHDDSDTWDLNIHGHLHNTCNQFGIDTYFKNSRYRLIALEFLDYKAVTLKEIINNTNERFYKKMVQDKKRREQLDGRAYNIRII
jgi:calcineurin-like phosphoesterase family protein